MTVGPAREPLPSPFDYVIDSSPAELAANLDRAIKAINEVAASEVAASGVEANEVAANEAALGAGSQPDELQPTAKALCAALGRFLRRSASREQAEAFWGAFKTMVPFLRHDSARSCAGHVDGQSLGELATPPVRHLCWALFEVHQYRREAGGSFDAELLEGLELALAVFEDAGGSGASSAGSYGYSRDKAEIIELLAQRAQLLFELDPGWTRQYMFRHLVRGDAYRQLAASKLTFWGGWPRREFLLAVQPYALEFCADVETLFEESGGRVRACEWLVRLAKRALADDDEASITEIAEALKGMPATLQGRFVHILREQFWELPGFLYEEMSDRELFELLSDRLNTAQMISTFWPTEPQYQSEETTMDFVGLLLDAGEHAPGIFEACRDFLVPLTEPIYHDTLHHKLLRSDQFIDFELVTPTVIAGIIELTTYQHGSHYQALAELHQQLTLRTTHNNSS